MNNAICWFEIPVADMDRAQRFYEAVLGAPTRREAMLGQELAVLPYEHGAGVGGALLRGGPFTPSDQGTVPYLPVAPSVAAALERAVAAGGTVTLSPVALPGEMGVYAHVLDTEGNRVGLHAAR
ncbi:MAG: VOC family protein [Rubrivivax sp.]